MKRMLKLALFLAFDLMAVNLTAIVGQSATPPMPTFFARRDYLIGSQFIQAADVNGDGIPDLLAFDVGTIIVQFGNGDGTFRSGPSTQTGAGGGGDQGFVPIDLNGDGKIDLVLSAGTGVNVAMGKGDGTFQPSVSYPISDIYVGALVLGDFNGDGILDVAAEGNTGVWLLTGKGGGTFNSAVLAVSVPECFNIAAGDFNQDGKLDLVVTQVIGNRGNGFTVLFGNGNGTFQTPQVFSVPNKPMAVAVGSLIKGGPPGIVLNESGSSEAYIYYGNGAGGFTGPRVVSLPGAGINNGLTLGDVNGDGYSDLISVGGYVAYGEGGGNFTSPVSFPVDSAGTPDIILADLRNNGLTDIVTSGSYAISVLLNDGNKGFEDGVWTSVTGGAGCGVKGDFNGDGKGDLAVNNANGISILLGTGKYATPFTAGTNIALAGADCMVTADVNGDGKLDLLVPVNGTVVTYLGNGDGTFQAPTDIVANPPEDGFSGIAAGDINNDGWRDLILTSNVFPVDANVTVLLNNHKGGFTQVPATFGALTSQPILADLNGDGDLDLILGGGSGAEIYLGNGTGEFTSTPGLPGLSLATNGLNCIADVNGDGIPDVLVSGYDTIEIYLGEGNATYATPFGVGTGPSPGSILAEQLHAANLPDIVAPDTSGGVMVLLNLTK
jgi:hypothetical protein